MYRSELKPRLPNGNQAGNCWGVKEFESEPAAIVQRADKNKVVLAEFASRRPTTRPTGCTESEQPGTVSCAAYDRDLPHTRQNSLWVNELSTLAKAIPVGTDFALRRGSGAEKVLVTSVDHSLRTGRVVIECRNQAATITRRREMLTWYLDSKTYFRWLRDLGDAWIGNGPSFSLTTNVLLSDSGVARFALPVLSRSSSSSPWR